MIGDKEGPEAVANEHHMNSIERQPIVLSMEPPFPEDGLTVGQQFAFAVRAECKSGSDLAGGAITVSIDGAAPIHSRLNQRLPEEPFNEAGPFVITAPESLGSHSCTLAIEGFDGCSKSIDFECQAAEISMTFWDAPKPIVSGQAFNLKVGAKSSLGVDLGGSEIRICDEAGSVLASERLREAPLENTDALYWTEISLAAPPCEDLIKWKVLFAAADAELPHAQAELPLRFTVVPAPIHTVAVTFVAEETGDAIPGAQIRLGSFRRVTDKTGVAKLPAATGIHRLAIWHPEYETDPTFVNVEGDTAFDVHGKAVPAYDPATSYWG